VAVGWAREEEMRVVDGGVGCEVEVCEVCV